ncbi:MAG: NAD(P)/FAD-dependent oxidoreductase [Bacteroidia bacterium]|nr:NAD(P)/FAD-dependent oxidoreductase [Bacteroidia bacterium]
MEETQKTAIIIGAGPAGLTAALELLRNTDIKPIILESSNDIGGISKTVNYKGNRMDIGGHRFFSKSDTVMNWWLELFPIQKLPDAEKDIAITYRQKSRNIHASSANADPETTDLVMLVRNRLSRIFYLRKLFAYPIKLNLTTLLNLGIFRTINIVFSYIWVKFFPIQKEKNLEDFLINRFGQTLYKTFFKDYTEKVWGKPCSEISAEWGAQRIKGVSISKAIAHALRFSVKKESNSISQKNTETSLIEKFLYPKLGPGQLWEEVARQIQEKGGEIHLNCWVDSVQINNNCISSVQASASGVSTRFSGNYYFSTMPVKDLITGMEGNVPIKVKEIATNLEYRDFVTVGLLVKKLLVTNKDGAPVTDNWIYIQENDVKIGRLQIFNNWSPYMVANPNNIWLGLEYFCNENDALWALSDKEFLDFAISELVKIGWVDLDDVLDGTVVKVPKTYPAYFGAYSEFDTVRKFTDTLDNLFLIGRNGMHKYNNQDHSMLTAITAVKNIVNGIDSRDNIWNINTEMEYHEEK